MTSNNEPVMNQRTEKRSPSISEQATEWLLELDDDNVDLEGRRAFLVWLKQSPQHIKEVLQITALEVEVGRNTRLTDTVDELVNQAKANTVIELGAVGDETHESATAAPPRASNRRWYGIAASFLLTAILSAWWWLALGPEEGVQHHRTETGEQRSIALDDGSMITLNTQSEIRVVIDDAQRHVTLVAGEALFDVEKDPARPFRVEAGPMNVTVFGTQFNVYRQAEQTVLTVVEGSVGVEAAARSSITTSAASNTRPLTARTGDRIAIEASGNIVQKPKPDVSQVTAWTERKLIFNNRPLSEVVAEFNRYNRTTLQVEDPALADRPIGGVFYAHDTDMLAVFLANQPGVRVERDSDVIRVLISNP